MDHETAAEWITLKPPPKLRLHAGEHDPRDWPRSPDALGRQVRRVVEPLRRLGVLVRAYRTADSVRERRISITREERVSADPRRSRVRSVRTDRTEDDSGYFREVIPLLAAGPHEPKVA